MDEEEDAGENGRTTRSEDALVMVKPNLLEMMHHGLSHRRINVTEPGNGDKACDSKRPGATRLAGA
jgi:hypothetical protein